MEGKWPKARRRRLQAIILVLAMTLVQKLNYEENMTLVCNGGAALKVHRVDVHRGVRIYLSCGANLCGMSTESVCLMSLWC